MRATGIVRRIDDLGRVVIPKEIRRNLRIHENDPLELFIEEIEGRPTLCLRKYETGFLNSLATLADDIDDELKDNATVGERRAIREKFNEIANILKDWENRG